MQSTEIKRFAMSLGADVCGVAGVDRFAEAPEGFHPRDILPQTQSVIVFGIQSPKGVFLAKTNAPYTLIRESFMHTIDAISIRIVMEIEKAGGGVALPIPSVEPYTNWDAENRQGRGILSLRHAAKLAGLGSLGKNTLLINEKFGNRLWLGAVLTDLALQEDPMAAELCRKGCRLCLDSCPQRALDGVTVIQKKCREICFSTTEGGGYLYACDVCRKVCPYCLI